MPSVTIILDNKPAAKFEADSIRLTATAMWIAIADDQQRQDAHAKLVKADVDAYVERPYPTEIWVDEFNAATFQIE